MQPDRFNALWILDTLKHRGLPKPDLEVILHGIAAMDTSLHEALTEKIERLQRGLERSGEMESVAQTMRDFRKAFEAAQHSSAPAAKVATIPTEAAQADIGEQQGVVTDWSTQRAHDPQRFEALHPDQKKVVRESHHVYSTKTALCIEPTCIEDIGAGPRMPDYHTLNIEMAKMDGAGRYNWQEKIVFRLTNRELPIFVAVMMGWISTTVDFKNHGKDKNKSMEITDQDKGVFIRLRHGTSNMSMPIPAEEIFAVCSLALATLARNTPNIDTQTLVLIVKRTATKYQSKCTT